MNNEVGNSYGEDYFSSHYSVLTDKTLYNIMSMYWRYTLFSLNDITTDSRVLDYGSGLGQISAALPNVTLFDPSSFAERFAVSRGRTFIVDPRNIPIKSFDVILSSHSLEHTPRPADDLISFHSYASDNCRLVLVLPAEYEMYAATQPLKIPRLQPDLHDQHLHCWTFQTITNLLAYCGWRAIVQKKIYGPFMLRSLSKVLNPNDSVRISHWLGSYKKNYPSILTIAVPVMGFVVPGAG
jgi:SAM-dependent methyltransferase